MLEMKSKVKGEINLRDISGKNKVAYLRVSTDEQDESTQINPICNKFFLKEKDLIIISEKVSAWNQEKEHLRDGFLTLKKLVTARKISEIYVFDIDRLYRNRKKLVEFYTYCKFYDVRIFSSNQEYLNKLVNIEMPVGLEFIGEQIFNNTLNLIAWLSEDESTKKSNRIKSKVRTKKGKTISVYGKQWGRKGLSKQTIKKVLQLKEENPNMSIREIASQSFYYNKNNDKKNLSKSAVHKIIKENEDKNV